MMRIIRLSAWVLFASGVVAWILQRQKRAPGIEHPIRHVESWDVVDEASWESFPASDPPAYH